jgi:hypothetical protein
MVKKMIEIDRKSEDFIDGRGYWIDLDRNVRRLSGEQEIVLRASEECTKAEWMLMIEWFGLGPEPS